MSKVILKTICLVIPQNIQMYIWHHYGLGFLTVHLTLIQLLIRLIFHPNLSVIPAILM